ncbi:hypothetical protein HND97_00050 [Vibrio cholerae]|nr:hypothetical protein HND97_00050 [Vibrio cholerae]
MVTQRAVFQEGAEKSGVDGELAEKIFDRVEKSPDTDLTNRTLPLMRWFLTKLYG